MLTAYVLINCEMGSEKSVLEQLKTMGGIQNAIRVYGAYDIIVKLASATEQELREIISNKIRKIEKIRSTLTLVIIEHQSWPVNSFG